MKNNFFLFSLLLALLFSACVTRYPGLPDDKQATRLQAISENPGAFKNKPVVIRGEYLGWSGAGCKLLKNAGHQITRSDWSFSDGEFCVYVTGGKPATFDPISGKDNGSQIVLTAIVRLSPEGKINLEYQSCQVLEPNKENLQRE